MANLIAELYNIDEGPSSLILNPLRKRLLCEALEILIGYIDDYGHQPGDQERNDQAMIDRDEVERMIKELGCK